jgi:hypothetical protein
MIDLQKPIRTKDGREAKYLGELPDGRVVLGYPAACSGRWCAYSYDPDELEAYGFSNMPPAPPKLTGYCPVYEDGYVGYKIPQIESLDRSEDFSGTVIDLSTLTEKNFVRIGA